MWRYGTETGSKELPRDRRVQPEVASTGVTPRGTQPGTGDAIPRSTRTGSLPAYPHSRVGLARVGHLQRASSTADRHAAGVRADHWAPLSVPSPDRAARKLDPSKCPVGSPHGCPISLVTSTARVKGGCRVTPCAPPPWLSWISTAPAPTHCLQVASDRRSGRHPPEKGERGPVLDSRPLGGSCQARSRPA